ncbi:hypothetical protein [Streptomyces sp. NPDC050485]|uniref:hypothetical protein n=1 Tax=Streptomyces sp. NPDC050485 TaxID=3365617 RepID=UPI00378E1FE4
MDVSDNPVAEIRGITYRAFRSVLRRNAEYITERSVPERLAVLGIPVLVISGAADPVGGRRRPISR